MNKWNTYTIDDLGMVNRGKSKHRPRNDPQLFGGDYPFIQTGDVKRSNLYITEYKDTYSEKGLAQSKLWSKGTLCITIAANIAESAILGVDACFPDSVVGFFPFEKKADSKFVKYLMDEFKIYAQQISKGTTQDNLSLEKLRKIKFRAPEYRVQVKISDILSAYDDLIENNNRRIALLEKVAQELYKEWFVRFRFPGHENTKFENGLPVRWKVKRIGDIVRVKSGYAFKSDWWIDEGVPVVKIKDIQNNTVDLGDLSYISQEHAEKAKQFYVVEGDLLLALTGATIGKLALVPFSDKQLIVNQRVGKFFVGNNPIDNVGFLYMTLQQNWVQELIIMISGSNAAQPNISPFDIEKIKVIYNEEMVDLYNNKVSDFIGEILQLKKQNQNLVKQRDLLLPRLMSGKLEV